MEYEAAGGAVAIPARPLLSLGSASVVRCPHRLPRPLYVNWRDRRAEPCELREQPRKHTGIGYPRPMNPVVSLQRLPGDALGCTHNRVRELAGHTGIEKCFPDVTGPPARLRHGRTAALGLWPVMN